MKTTCRILILALACLAGVNERAFAEPDYTEVKIRYPKAAYIMGIGESRKTDNPMKDKRVAQVMARLDIAKQIRVHISEKTIDVMCEGIRAVLFRNGEECRSEFRMVIEESVDLFLEGSRIVSEGSRGEMMYAVAVLDRSEAGDRLEERSREAVVQAKEDLEKAKGGDKDALKQAKEEYKKAVAYEKEKEVIAGVRSKADAAFQDVEQELLNNNINQRKQ